MEADEIPLISILMSVYEPRMDWLKEQLDSLNVQTYPNLRLYVRDDCSSTVPFETIERLVRQRITAFPYVIERNEKNLGSNVTFELLTQEAEGTYFAYCDQDDVWLPEKLSVLKETMERENASLVCADMYIIDGRGLYVGDSITKVRKHHVFRNGTGLASKLLISNFVTGCNMLIRAEIAKASVPFCPDMVHDHYLALCAAHIGKIVSLSDHLIRYRIHENNQTLMMKGIVDKESYCRIQIETLIRRLIWLKGRFGDDRELLSEIESALEWAQAREMNFRGDHSVRRIILRKCRFSPLTSLFECIFSDAPKSIFMFFIRLKMDNII